MRVEVDLAALVENWRAFDTRGAAEAGAVVKADGYGLGAAACARTLAAAGARTFFTATVAEAAAVRTALGPGPRIAPLNPSSSDEFALLAAHALTPVLNSAAEAAAWRAAGAPGAGCIVHLDTGMNRLGAPPETWAALAAATPAPAIAMSHLACAEASDDPMNALQRKRFLEGAALFPEARKSLASTAGALLGPDYAFDLLRPGIGLYGGHEGFACVARLLAPILQVRTIQPGETVGYGATFRADRARRIATLAAGYADGLLRALSGRGYGVLDGRRCPFAGRVSMDLITLDVTDVGEAACVGAEVELIGPSAPIAEIAAAAGTLPYELLTGLRAADRRYLGAPA